MQFWFHLNVQTETEHWILATQNRTEQLLFFRQSEKEKEPRRKREGNEKQRRKEKETIRKQEGKDKKRKETRRK